MFQIRFKGYSLMLCHFTNGAAVTGKCSYMYAKTEMQNSAGNLISKIS